MLYDEWLWPNDVWLYKACWIVPFISWMVTDINWKGVDGEISSCWVIGKSLPEECHCSFFFCLIKAWSAGRTDKDGREVDLPGSDEVAVLKQQLKFSLYWHLSIINNFTGLYISFKDHSFLSVILKDIHKTALKKTRLSWNCSVLVLRF